MSQFNIKDFDINNNICIEASAGTGKTYTVQQIVAELLRLKKSDNLKDEITLDKVLIVTFTEKAAGELRDRIRAKIQEVCDTIENEKDEEFKKKYPEAKYLSKTEQKKKFTQQLALVDNAPIYTIHSFCKQTLTEFGFNARQADGLELIDESNSAIFIEKWIRDYLSSNQLYQKYFAISEGKSIEVDDYQKALTKYYLDKDWNENSEIITLDKTITDDDITDISRFTIDEVKSIKTNVKYYNRNYYFNCNNINYVCNLYDKLHDKAITTVVDDKRNTDESNTYINYLKAILNDLNAKVTGTVSKALATRIANTEKLIYNFENKVGNTNIMDNSVKLFPVAEYFGQGIIPQQQQYMAFFNDLKEKIIAIGEFNKSTSTNPEPVFQNKIRIHLFETMLPKLYKDWNQYKADNKMQSFDDMIRNVREAVMDNSLDLRQKLQNKYTYAIIDEFQDTNQRQWDIFSSIFMEDENHSICVVGDPKQSIYAFQGADVNVYTKAINQIKDSNKDQAVVNNLPYNLGRNYRSTNNIIDVCNALFDDNRLGRFFEQNTFTFSYSGYPENTKDVKPNAKYEDNEVPSIWIPSFKEAPLSLETSFAEFAARQIIDFCTLDTHDKTKLQIYKKNSKDADGNFVLTDINFADFAVLCKSTSEMEEIKRVFNSYGIPYSHYKESNLFKSKECRDWIALFNAIGAKDFSSTNRKILNECLYSSFFNIPLNNINDIKYDKPDCLERLQIVKWQQIAKERKWAILQEKIFEMTEVENRLSQLDKLTNLTKLRQIGDYCVYYLYKNSCSIDELVNHLRMLNKQKADVDQDDGNLVQKGTDFNAVQIMTIHASKGLEFPVVIAPAGIKGLRAASEGFVLYHDQNNKQHLTYNKGYIFDKSCKAAVEIADEEDMLEWCRKYYVCYTRASSIMIMPFDVSKDFSNLKELFKSFLETDPQFIKQVEVDDDYNSNYAKEQVKKILQGLSKNSDNKTENLQEFNKQKEALKEISKNIKELDVSKLSYSNLSHGKKDKTTEDDEAHDVDTSAFDAHSSPSIECNYDKENLNIINQFYPKGNLLGEAIHQTFEECNFFKTGNLISEDDAKKDEALCYLACNKLRGQGFVIDDTDSKSIVKQSASIVWNTLNAVLPEIKGNSATGESFSLKELKDTEHFAELEFNMNPEIKQNERAIRDFFNGFIDLLFVRTAKDGSQIYSVLDWKSDSMDSMDYTNTEVLKEHTDKLYSIQRVLYSYCLIKWLKQFNPSLSEEQIFEQKFGGIYYVYVRGCKAKTGNGIYAKTWDSWQDLEKAFNEIVEAKIQ